MRGYIKMLRWLNPVITLIALTIVSIGNSYAVDSTGTATSTTTPQTVVARQAYLLDSGYWDTQGMLSPGDFGTHNPIGIAPPNQCPTGFEPVVVLNIYKMNPSGAPSYACANAVTKNGTIDYAVNISFSTSYNTSAGQFYGNVGIYYSLYCYPQGVVSPTTMNVSTCSTSSVLPFLLDSGTAKVGSYIGWSTSFWFEVWKQCPPGYAPYAFFSPGTMSTAATTQSLSSIYTYPINVKGACNFNGNQETAVLFNTGYAQTPGTPTTNYSGLSGQQSGIVNYQLYCYPTTATTPGGSVIGSAPGYYLGSGVSSGPLGAWMDLGNNVYGKNPPCTP